MEVLYLLVPLSLLIVFAILAVLYWAVESGQFEDIESAGQQVLALPESDAAQPPAPAKRE